ncbi:MAG TPA: alanine dehydrogenase [Acidobacteriota bacterium]|nr:alanine dehydrogenase [Acidobacteriota bacterium]
MIIGIPKETAVRGGVEEKRVSLSPPAVRELTNRGIQVLVEKNAGDGAHFSDDDYSQAGAVIVYSREEAYRRADLVVKVQAPLEEEWDYLREDQILFGFLLLALAPKRLLELLLERNILSIGMELVQRDDGTHPLQQPMSKIAGKMAPQVAGRLLQANVKGGRGILLGGIEGIPPAEVVILGGGTLGACAARSFRGLGCSVYVVDKDLRQLEKVSREVPGAITIFSNQRNLAQLTSFADVLVAAVQVPGERTPVLITREMVKTMRKGSVIIDFSIDQGGAVETSRLTPSEEYSFSLEGVIHFAVPNLPSWVPRTSSHALSNALLPYLLALAEQGWQKALRHLTDLRRGVWTCKGYSTRPHMTDAGGDYRSIETLLEES